MSGPWSPGPLWLSVRTRPFVWPGLSTVTCGAARRRPGKERNASNWPVCTGCFALSSGVPLERAKPFVRCHLAALALLALALPALALALALLALALPLLALSALVATSAPAARPRN